ncbi:ArsR/SmtB family transcription factor [Evansella halocellulosilytica]|uniref:ArsR/SmtB family transcription factor n=1 Tax=Evansella halocellulosilytica TaxID=2011013 RepID=UPI000BB77018|nr:winged helix-turn-helix domain-containing protein [Evansella halocellulosilytica]
MKYNLYFEQSTVAELLASMLRVVSHNKIVENEEHRPHILPEIDVWVKEMNEKLPDEIKEELHTFFDSESYLGVTLLSPAVEKGVYKDVHSFISMLHQMPIDELFYHFTHAGYSPSEQLDSYDDPEKVIPFLDKLNLPLSERWKLSYLIFDGERTKKRFIQLIERFYYQYFQPFEEKVLNVQKEFLNELEGGVKSGQGGYLNDLLIQYGVENEFDGDVYILSSYFHDTGLMFSQLNEPALTTVILGTRHIETFFMSRGDKEVLDAVRVMTDERRYKILNTLKQKPRYGYELAQELGVSNSTMSHHLSSLVSQHLVKAVRKENKVYYEVNRGEVQSILKQLEKMLIE